MNIRKRYFFVKIYKAVFSVLEGAVFFDCKDSAVLKGFGGFCDAKIRFIYRNKCCFLCVS